MVTLFGNIERAAFIDRPNRFTIRCIAKGKQVPAYLPNPGRLWELMIPGATVYLERAVRGGRKLPFTAVAVERSGTPVMLHTHRTNDVASDLIDKGLIPGLEGARIRRREVPVNHSRIDFLLDRGREQIFLEVKSCTLFSKSVAMFPDAVTARGKRHLEDLVKISGKGRRGAILFIVHSPHPKFFLPEYHTDLAFSRSLLESKNRLKIIPVAIGWKRNLTLEEKVAPLIIPWKVLAKEAEDRGSYLIILRLPRRKVLSVGKLGKVPFQKGYYVYTGSAKKNLTRRLQRHRRLMKKHFWHIDYLREAGEFIAALPVRTEDDLECQIARSITSLADWKIPAFGSSDCSCTTHLSGMEDNPLRSPAFHEMLQYFRMERLIPDK